MTKSNAWLASLVQPQCNGVYIKAESSGDSNQLAKSVESCRANMSVVTSSSGSSASVEINSSLFGLLSAKLRQLHEADPNLKLFITGHSMGGALSAIFAAALSVNEPDSGADEREWIAPKVRLLVYGAFAVFFQNKIQH